MRRLIYAALVVAVLVGGCKKEEAPSVAAENSSSTDSRQRYTVETEAKSPVLTPVGSVVPPAFDPKAIPGMIRIDDKAYLLLSSIWPPNPANKITTIPVCWEADSPTGVERDWVRTAILDSWQANSAGKLRFIGFGQCAAASTGVRIAVRDDGSNNGPHTAGLGKKLNGIKNGMILNFTFRTWSPSCASSEMTRERCIRSIAVHEFGHALGFAHEQNRADTPGECTQKPQGPNGDVMLTPWDLNSVMNYCNPVYNNDGRLSTYDIEGLRKAYHG